MVEDEKGSEVADDVEDGVGGGGIGVAIATEFGGVGGYLVVPGEPELQEAMDGEHWWCGRGAVLGDSEGDAVVGINSEGPSCYDPSKRDRVDSIGGRNG